MYTEEQIQEWKSKAEKWDQLDKKIESCYGKENEDGEWEPFEDEDEGCDLGYIGELAARAFGYL
ncbi:hypothetical protein [Chitinophaga pinensis]|uniref:Uncharacterized protein n=1 Tax=Chitinophaga pinensis (strain ATCC 43595 / DSM 2588 / LMG 13176 / NBRC 15968 / NCIMB 11800 / UQM 2034) TaxID=485918 RepID=A0A979G5K6_CHIPD|nr:hypothetical protein [Chitinophaga pinensis]ACU61299.1 hypothetical protein Cpin_3837 [Chitinophaga pinensis DSM 2588]